MKNLTVYNINYGKSPLSFIAIADNNIPLVFFKEFFDIYNSIFFEKFVKSSSLSVIKKICKDTKKEAILNCNNSDSDIVEICKMVLGHKVIWKNYSLKSWNFFINGIEYYSSEFKIEIDHPINIKEKDIVNIVYNGNKSFKEKYNI